MSPNFQTFFQLLKQKQSFLISCHIHPDGDAIGSMVALGLVLTEMGKEVQLVCNEGVPAVYSFLDGVASIRRQPDPEQKPQVLICVDCAEIERVALPRESWQNHHWTVVNIDHHITNLGFGDLNLNDPHAAATGEVVFHLLEAGKFAISSAAATAIYTAIATDTGFFRFANTSAATLELAASLIKDYQVEPVRVAEMVHEQKSFNAIRLLGEVLSTLQLGMDNRVAWMVLDQAMLARFPVENEETESYVNYARSIEGVEVGMLFKEMRPNEIKLSWRSTAAVDVSKLAAYFGGGGHARAAGCNLTGPLDQVVRRVLEFVAEFYMAN